MSDSSTALVVIAFGVFGILWSVSGTEPRLVETMRPVECKLSKDPKGRDTCSYSFMGTIELRANLPASEVSVVRDGLIAGAYKYTDCSIIDAENWICRQVHPPLGNSFRTTVVTEKGQFLKSSNPASKICYPGRVVRWMIEAGAFTTNQDTIAPTLLNCSG